MGAAQLTEFLRRQRSVPPSDVKDEWTKALTGLFDQMRAWLKPAQDEKLLNVEAPMMTINEPSLGTYDAISLRILAGARVVDVQPVARVVFGGSGRVDMGSGPRMRVIMRTPDKSQWLVSTSDPKDEGELLTEETFTEALQYLLA
jgi:hypothetical protein